MPTSRSTSAPRSRPTCRAEGCKNSRSASHLICRECWSAVPAPIRAQVLATYRPTAGIRQSHEYFQAVAAALESLKTGAGRAANTDRGAS